MSEVDRLSNSGLYPALPIADRRSSKEEDAERRPRSDPLHKPLPKAGDRSDPRASPRPPKSVIDDYA
jgi:hypothetical protein